MKKTVTAHITTTRDTELSKNSDVIVLQCVTVGTGRDKDLNES